MTTKLFAIAVLSLEWLRRFSDIMSCRALACCSYLLIRSIEAWTFWSMNLELIVPAGFRGRVTKVLFGFDFLLEAYSLSLNALN